MQISGSIALVTGSARRIGRSIALALASQGARLAIHYRSSDQEATGTLDSAQELGADAELFRADLVDREQISALIDGVQTRFGGLDILVNNASVFGPASLDETTPELWDEQMDTNAVRRSVASIR